MPTAMRMQLFFGTIVITLFHAIIAPPETPLRANTVLSSQSNSPPASIQVSVSAMTTGTGEKPKKNRLGTILPVTRNRVHRAEQVAANTGEQMQNLLNIVSSHAETLERQMNTEKDFHEQVKTLRSELDNLSAKFSSDSDNSALCQRIDSIERDHANILSKAPEKGLDAATKEELNTIKKKLDDRIATLEQEAKNDNNAATLLAEIRADIKTREAETERHNAELKETVDNVVQSVNGVKTELTNSKNEAAKAVADLQQQLSDMHKLVATLTQRCEAAELKAAGVAVDAQTANLTANDASNNAKLAAANAKTATATAKRAETIARRKVNTATQPQKPSTHAATKPQKSNTPASDLQSTQRPLRVLPRHRINHGNLYEFFYVVYVLSEEAVKRPQIPAVLCTEKSQSSIRAFYKLTWAEGKELENLCSFMMSLRYPISSALDAQIKADVRQINNDVFVSVAVAIKLISHARAAYDEMSLLQRLRYILLDMSLSTNYSTLNQRFGREMGKLKVAVPILLLGNEYE